MKNLSAAVREVAEHEGVVWTPVVSMRRADAERLGYTDVENWRAVVNASINEIAEGYKIAPNHQQGIRTVKSAFARHIKGRKVYGYLPPQVKQLVDAIVDELARDERVAEAYSLWQELRDERIAMGHKPDDHEKQVQQKM